MPEGPEVTISAELLNRTLSGCRMISVKIISGRYARKPPVGWTAFLRSLPLSIENVDNKGKFMWFTMSDGWWIFNTLGLTGKWTFTKEKNSRIEFVFTRTRNISTQSVIGNELPPIVYSPSRELIPPSSINTSRTFKMWYTDDMSYGTLKFTNLRGELEKKLRDLGIDVLRGSYKLQQFANQLFKGKRSVYETLLNQKLFAGIGNYLVNEILYRARVAPSRKISSLTEREIRKLYTYTKYITKKSYLSQGGKSNYLPCTPSSYNFRFKVYKQSTCPDGSPTTRTILLRGRSVYWCPNQQH